MITLWAHYDERGLSATARGALARVGSDAPWSPAQDLATQVRDLRGLYAATLAAAASGLDGGNLRAPAQVVSVDLTTARYLSAVDEQAAAALCRTTAILSGGAGADWTVRTQGGASALRFADTGPLDDLDQAVADVLGVVAQPIVLGCFFAGVIVRKLWIEPDLRELTRLHGECVSIVAAHRASERAVAQHSGAHKAIPWNAAEVGQFQALIAAQDRVARKYKLIGLAWNARDPWSYYKHITRPGGSLDDWWQKVKANAVAPFGGGMLVGLALAAWLYWETRRR